MNPQYIKDRTYRVLIDYAYKNNCYSSGAGFFISPTRFLTCCHVVLGNDLSIIRKDRDYLDTAGADEHEKLNQYYEQKKPAVKIESQDGKRSETRLIYFDAIHDIALLEIAASDIEPLVCDLDTEAQFAYGNEVAYGGFPSQFSYSYDKTPFAYHEGIVSSFPTTTIAGGEYEQLQINSINLSGNSGAPLFKKDGESVVGIINGNMNWGRDDLVTMKNVPGQPPVFEQASNRVPLSICYATPLETLKVKTLVFDQK